MAEGGLFGGFSSGIKKGLSLQQDQLQLERKKEADDALATYRQGQQAIAKRRLEVQEKNLDLTVTNRLRQVLSDPNLHPEARSFLLDETITSLGYDPKSERYKGLKNVLLKMPIDQANALSEALVTALPKAEPGMIRGVVDNLLKGKVSPGDIPKLVQGLVQQGSRADILGDRGAAPQEGAPQAGALQTPTASPMGGDIEAPATAPAAPVGAAQPTMSKEDQVRDLRSKAQALGATGDLDGMKATLQMARDIEGKPTTEINFLTQKKEAELLATRDFDIAKSIDDDADGARKADVSIRAFETALEGGRFAPGAFSGARLSLSRIAEFVGINPESKEFKAMGLGDPASGELMEGASQRLGLDLADKLSKMTNMSLNFIRSSIPNLSRTRGGNELILDMMKAGNSRTKELHALKEHYLDTYGSLRPEGKRSFFQQAASLREQPLFDEDFVKKVQKEARNGTVVDLPGRLDKSKLPKLGDKVLVGPAGREYTVVGEEQGIPVINKDGLRLPIITTTEQYDALDADTPYFWGPTGEQGIKGRR